MDTDLIDEIVEKSEYSNVTKTPISTPSSVVTEAELERLRHLEVLFKTTERTAKIGYYEWNYEKDRLETCSEEYARIFGMSLEQIMEAHSNWDKVVTQVHPEDRELFVKSNDEMREHHHFDMEYRINLDNGEIRYLREICVSVIDGMDFVKINFGIIQDITEQKIAEQKIIAAKETLEQQVIERTRDLADTVKQLEEEITERKKVSAELQFLANHDALTGLPSLRLGKDRVQQALARSRREQKNCAVMFLDLDGFKQVNDEHGHEAGDHVLKVTADRIKGEIRETDCAARIGGDEFMIVLTSIPEASIIKRIASSMIEQIGQSIRVNSANITIGASIGIALYPENGAVVEELIQAADKAMYRVKSKGKNNFGFTGDT